MIQITKITNEYITFAVKSHSRDIYHEIIFNRATHEWSCTCEDYWYRKRECKHMRQIKNFVNMLNIELSQSNTTEVYIGQTIDTSIEA